MRNFVWALDENNKPCKCYALPENRGRGNCNHKFHAEEGESVSDFFSAHGFKVKTGSTTETIKTDYILTMPYHLTEEEKKGMLEIKTKKDLLLKRESDNGAYMHLEDPLWNDADKNYFSDITGMPVDTINDILHEKTFIYTLEGPNCGNVISDKERIKELNAASEEEFHKKVVETGLSALNKFAKYKGYEATKDVYVLPYYMRAGCLKKDGEEINSDETEHYLNLFNIRGRRDKDLSKQLVYERLISYKKKKKGAGYEAKTLSDRLFGKEHGIWRTELTGSTIPYAGRAVAIPDSDMAYDEVKIPSSVAVDIFRPTVKRYLSKKGFTPEQISELIYNAKENQTEVDGMTRNLLQEALTWGNTRVIINRQPSLHKASMLGMKPLISPFPTIHTNPLIAAGMNLDHDGDTVAMIGINNEEIVKKVDKELHPRNFKYEPKKQDSLMMKPTKDALFGLMSVLTQRTN